jgi:L-ascorbate metabolism protein UlaG (beta-lactamase superfamily)
MSAQTVLSAAAARASLTAYSRLFPRYEAPAEFRPRGNIAGTAVKLTWLGIAGFSIEYAGTTVLVDPYLSRPGFRELALRKLQPNSAELARYLPEKVDAVVCGHSHFDHAADAPAIAKLKNALLIGSASTCNWGRAAGLPAAQICEMPGGGAEVAVGSMRIKLIASRHGKAVLGRIPLPGAVTEVPDAPGRFWHYRMGGAYGVLFKMDALSIYHNGSADLIDHELEGEKADVLLACLAGRKGTERYLSRLVDALAPGLIVPSHYDAFFAPIERGLHLLPNIDVAGFLAEARLFAPKSARIMPGYMESIHVPAGDARAAILAA